MKSRRLLFILFLATALLAGCREDPSGAVLKLESGQTGFFKINGASLYYRVVGEGEPILFVHGGPNLDHSYFLPAMETLAGEYQLIFYDQRSHGRSSAGPDSQPLSMDLLADDIDGIRRELGIDKLSLIAHSWGGLVGMWYASRHPATLDKLILINSNAATSNQQYMVHADSIIRSRITVEDQEAQAVIFQSEEFQNGDHEAIEALFRLNLKYSFFDLEKVNDLTLEVQPGFVERNERLQQLAGQLADYDLRPGLSQLQCPALLLRGVQDPLPLAATEEIRDAIPGAQLVVIDSCGHFPFVEQPRQFFDAMRSFLGR